MRRVKAALSVIARLLAGYVIAVAASVAMVKFVMVLPTIFPDDGRWGPFYAHMRDVGSVLMIGLSITGATAWPGYLVTLRLSLTGPAHLTKRGFAIAGALTAIQAVLLLSLLDFRPLIRELFVPRIFIPILIGGFFGGYIYGCVHPFLFPGKSRYA